MFREITIEDNKGRWRDSFVKVFFWIALVIPAAIITAVVVGVIVWTTTKDTARRLPKCQGDGFVLVDSTREACQKAWKEGELTFFDPWRRQCCYTGRSR